MAQNLEEKKLSSQIVYDGSFLRVSKDEVRLPNGHTASREYVLHPGAAMIIPVLPNGNLLMIRQYRYPLHRVFLEFPAGKSDPQEKPLATAQRELREETGCEAKNWKHLTSIHPVIAYSTEQIDLFLATDLTRHEAQLDAEEFLDVLEKPFDEVFALMKQGYITDVKTMIGLFWYEKVLRAEF